MSATFVVSPPAPHFGILFTRAVDKGIENHRSRSSSLDPRQFAIAERGAGHKSATSWLEPLQLGDISGL